MKIVLASGSPRRRELLSLITENFAVCPADADESLRDGAPLADEVVRLSRLKAEAAMQSHPDAVCIGSDTMVTIDHLPLGKPKDRADAADMLCRLRGRTHEVLTGLAVLSPDGIQGHGALLIEGICGDYYSVMGLPVAPLGVMLRKLNAVR